MNLIEVLTLRDFHTFLEVLKLIGHYNEFDKRIITNMTKTKDNEENISCIFELSENKENSYNKTIYQIITYKDYIECIINNNFKYTIKQNKNNKLDILFQNYKLNEIEIQPIADLRKNYLKRKKREY